MRDLRFIAICQKKRVTNIEHLSINFTVIFAPTKIAKIMPSLVI